MLREDSMRPSGARAHLYPQRYTGTMRRSLCRISSRQDDERIVGMHVVGDRAAEIVQGFALAIKLGATKARAENCDDYSAEVAFAKRR